jgi:hypothetical protein
MSAPLTTDEALANSCAHHRLSRPGMSVVDTAAAIVGLHNTSPVSPYLSLRARIPEFGRKDFDTAAWERWELVRFRAMRMTMFLFPRDLLEIAAAATRHLRERWAVRWLRDVGLSQAQYDELADRIEAALAEGPLTSRSLRSRLGVAKEVPLPGVVSRMCDIGRLVGGSPPRAWRSPVREYHRWFDVVPAVDIDRWEEAPAIRELIRRYIGSYGPVTVDDVSWWTGISKAKCRQALSELAADVEQVTVEDWSGPLWRSTSGPPVELDDHVKALPLLDPYVQGYRNRDRFLDPIRYDYVYDGGGNSSATVVHRGRVIGVWQSSEDPVPSIRFHLFDRHPRPVRDAAEEELAAAGAMFFDDSVDVVEIAEMAALSDGGGRSAMHPLDDTIHRASRRD